MANSKKKHTPMRGRMRRANNFRLVVGSLSRCSQCGVAVMSHRALFSYNPEKQLSKIKCPTLLLYSSQRSPMLVRVEAVKALIPNYEVKILDGVNPWEKPEELAQVMLDFLK